MDNEHTYDSTEGRLSEVGVHAGFPNPAAQRDHRAPTLSLDQLLVSRPSSTYFFRLKGHQWTSQGVDDGDIAVVDRALLATPHDLVVAWRGDEFLLGRRSELGKRIDTWGVVTSIVHTYHEAS
jgi:DNA polymerase V